LLNELGIKQIRCRVHTPETNGKIERYFGKRVGDRGFKNFWGLEDLEAVYKRLKGGGEFNLEGAEFNKVPEVVLAYRQAA
jgi:transposase InsO family protein